MGDEKLGHNLTEKQCAEECKQHPECTFFVFGINQKAGMCYVEFTESEACEEGYEEDEFNFYKLKEDIRIEIEANEEHRIFYKNTYDFKDNDIDVFGFDNNTVQSVRITALPQRGVLKNLGEEVRLNEKIRKHNLDMVFH